MAITLTPYKVLAFVLGLLALLAIGLLGGWHVRGWRDGAAQLKASQQAIQQYGQQVSDMAKASNALNDTIMQQNKTTDDNIAGLATALGVQNHALTQLQLDVKSLPVGSCAFTRDADGLYQRAYQAAFGTAPPDRGEARKAGGRHAAH